MMILKENWFEDDRKEKVLTDVLTTREIERLYNLPMNKVVQDISRGKVSVGHFRKSGKIWLVTRAESNRLYSNYKRTYGTGKNQVSD